MVGMRPVLYLAVGQAALLARRLEPGGQVGRRVPRRIARAQTAGLLDATVHAQAVLEELGTAAQRPHRPTPRRASRTVAGVTLRSQCGPVFVGFDGLRSRSAFR